MILYAQLLERELRGVRFNIQPRGEKGNARAKVSVIFLKLDEEGGNYFFLNRSYKGNS